MEYFWIGFYGTFGVILGVICAFIVLGLATVLILAILAMVGYIFNLGGR